MTAVDHEIGLAWLRDGWECAASTDSMGNILTRGHPWDTDEFFATGTDEIEKCLARLDGLGVRGRGRARALDFGCGIGRLTQALAAEYRQVVGIDIAPEMVRQAEGLNRHPGRVSYVASATLPERQRFDFIYCNLVLQHMPQVHAHDYVAGFVGILKPGGLACFTVPHGPDYVHEGSHLSMYGSSPDTIAGVVEAAGGRMLDVEDLGHFAHWDCYRYTAGRRTTKR